MVQLHSVLSKSLRKSSIATPTEDLAHALGTLEERIWHSQPGKKIAAFDLDNTLLVGDIGEAVFAVLVLQGYIPRHAWELYRKLLATNRWEAYCGVVTAMHGLSKRLIHNVTLDVMSPRMEVLELDTSFIPVPRPHPAMVQFIATLRSLGYQVCVISASNEISARAAAWKLFNIPPFYVYGIRQSIRDGVLTSDLCHPIPIGAGKVEAFRKFLGSIDPLITAGDTVFDVPMLRITDPRGLSVWVGEEKSGFENVRREIRSSHEILFLQRPAPLDLDEKSFDR